MAYSSILICPHAKYGKSDTLVEHQLQLQPEKASNTTALEHGLTHDRALRRMNTPTQNRQKSGEHSALEDLCERGVRAPGFAEGYAVRDAVMQAGRMVRAMRNDAGFTQTQLAERAGMSQAEISRLEAGLGRHGPSVEILNRLAKACDLRLVMAMTELSASANDGKPPQLKYLAKM